VVDAEQVGLALTAFVSMAPFDRSAPDDVPDRLADIAEIEACHSVAGEESYILKVRVAAPSDLEHLLAHVRGAANVSTRTTVCLCGRQRRPMGTFGAHHRADWHIAHTRTACRVTERTNPGRTAA
jgi:DNA-binding Lrp family transcriptional regulator